MKQLPASHYRKSQYSRLGNAIQHSLSSGKNGKMKLKKNFSPAKQYLKKLNANRKPRDFLPTRFRDNKVSRAKSLAVRCAEIVVLGV